ERNGNFRDFVLRWKHENFIQISSRGHSEQQMKACGFRVLLFFCNGESCFPDCFPTERAITQSPAPSFPDSVLKSLCPSFLSDVDMVKNTQNTSSLTVRISKGTVTFTTHPEAPEERWQLNLLEDPVFSDRSSCL
ncbi:hypothetical protein DNTS_003173, partial [Danionella cerebrum]